MNFCEAWNEAKEGDVLAWGNQYEHTHTVTKKCQESLEWDGENRAPFQDTLTRSDWHVLKTSKVKITCEGKTVEISRESAKALNLI